MAARVNFLPSGWGPEERKEKKEKRTAQQAGSFLTVAQKSLLWQWPELHSESPTQSSGGTPASGDLRLGFPTWKMGIWMTGLLDFQNSEAALK